MGGYGWFSLTGNGLAFCAMNLSMWSATVESHLNNGQKKVAAGGTSGSVERAVKGKSLFSAFPAGMSHLRAKLDKSGLNSEISVVVTEA